MALNTRDVKLDWLSKREPTLEYVCSKRDLEAGLEGRQCRRAVEAREPAPAPALEYVCSKRDLEAGLEGRQCRRAVEVARD